MTRFALEIENTNPILHFHVGLHTRRQNRGGTIPYGTACERQVEPSEPLSRSSSKRHHASVAYVVPDSDSTVQQRYGTILLVRPEILIPPTGPRRGM